jgi:hypothetical protein
MNANRAVGEDPVSDDATNASASEHNANARHPDVLAAPRKDPPASAVKRASAGRPTHSRCVIEQPSEPSLSEQAKHRYGPVSRWRCPGRRWGGGCTESSTLTSDTRRTRLPAASMLGHMVNAFEGLIDRLLGASAEFERKLRAVRSEQWSWPTPCTEWNVRQLVNCWWTVPSA